MIDPPVSDVRSRISASEALESDQAIVPDSSDPKTCPVQDHMGIQSEDAQVKTDSSTEPFLPALARSLRQALRDHEPEDSADLHFHAGDLIECLGETEDPDLFRGRKYSGKTGEKIGVYSRKHVSNVDPTDPAFHHALAQIQHRDDITAADEEDSTHSELGQWEERLDILSRMNTPSVKEMLCTSFVHGVCREGDKCKFSHNLNTATFALCEKFAAGTCTDSACTLTHLRFPYVEDQQEEKILSDLPEVKLRDPSPAADPYVFGSIARQDSNIRPDLLMPGGPYAPTDSNTLEAILKNGPQYGTNTRGFVPSRSVPLQQLRENKQRTPPMPSKPSKLDTSSTANSVDMNARLRQLRSQLFDAGKTDLFYTLTRSQDSTQPKTAVLNIAALQHMALHQLQYDISCYVALMYRNSQFYMEIQGFAPLVELMNNYCDTIRNLDYMKQCATRGYEEDPFLMKSSRALERSILETTKLIPNHVLPAGPLPLPNDHANPQLRDTGRNEANRAAYQKNRLLRFTMGGVGALLLVVPMLIMANIPGKTASLVTTCIALLIFSALIPLLTELGPNEILATTAAYAAVLVVFVGTSLTTNAVVVAPTA